MSKTKPARAPRDRGSHEKSADRTAAEPPRIVPDPPRKRPVWLVLSIALLTAWIMFLLVMAYGGVSGG